MVSLSIVRNVVGIIGNVISIILFLSPMPTFVHIWRQGSVEQYSPLPYLAALINCMVWVLYGLPMVHPNSTLVLTTNGSGMAIEIVYIILFLIYSSEKKQRLKVLLIVLVEVIFMAIYATLILTVARGTKKRTLIAGIGGICFNIMMYASPLSIMKMVITTKSVEYMPFFLSFASFCNGVAWTIYATMPIDFNILVPNGLGTLLSVAQLVLYAVYYKSTKRQIAERRAKGEVALSEVLVNGDSRKAGIGSENGHGSQAGRA